MIDEEVEIVGVTEETHTVVVTGIEMFRKLLDEAMPGDNVEMTVELIHRVAMEQSLRFAICEELRGKVSTSIFNTIVYTDTKNKLNLLKNICRKFKGSIA